MAERFTHQTVTFTQPFSIAGVEGKFPPGNFEIEVTEEELPGLSFIAYRRRSTTIRLPGLRAGSPYWQVVEIEPSDLATSLARDEGGCGFDHDFEIQSAVSPV